MVFDEFDETLFIGSSVSFGVNVGVTASGREHHVSETY